MPRSQSTFIKRQKEHTRQQRQKDKAERRNQRKQEKAVVGSVDETAALREHAAAQAALFNFTAGDAETAAESTPGGCLATDS
jgi:hypothetical protein